MRRWDGGATVAVRIKGRSLVAVIADMIEGSVVTNRLTSPRADRLRDELWDALAPVVTPKTNTLAASAPRRKVA